MLGFCTHPLLYDFYLCQFFNGVKTKTLKIIMPMLVFSCDKMLIFLQNEVIWDKILANFGPPQSAKTQ